MSDLKDIENLIARVALRDRAAFGELYTRTSAKLFGVVLRVLDNRAEAEDVIQDAYVKIWRNAGRYTQNGFSPMTWLITIARNTAIDARRRKTRTDVQSDAMLEQVADSAPGPEAAAIAASDRAALGSCLDELQQVRAEAVTRAYLEGDSYADLAAHFDVPLNTMRTWLRRSLLKLRECLTR
ncbi:MAG: sigma-70 family RNA polymerase sigma factor [Roseovarius sp.]|nr:sigma-70 family RNA polymerase sigma factor [Roseovarius sp.]